MPHEPEAQENAAWEDWGRLDPYFAVLTDERFRRGQITDAARKDFFESGFTHVRHILAKIRQHLDPNFKPSVSLDFGCGVGRVSLALASISDKVIGVDVSSAMLAEARTNAEKAKCRNIEFLGPNYDLAEISGEINFVHSYIVFQHIAPPRGYVFFEKLVDLLAPNGIGVCHFTFAKTYMASKFGETAARQPSTLLERLFPWRRSAPLLPPALIHGDPEMAMHCYRLDEIFFTLATRGLTETHVELTNHGGELGTLVFFKKNSID